MGWQEGRGGGAGQTKNTDRMQGGPVMVVTAIAGLSGIKGNSNSTLSRSRFDASGGAGM